MKEILTMIILFVLTIVGWSPATFYLGKWSDYWDPYTSSTANLDNIEPNRKWERYENASDKCSERTAKYFITSTSSVMAIVVDDSKEYYTYECYGIKLQKIPK